MNVTCLRGSAPTWDWGNPYPADARSGSTPGETSRNGCPEVVRRGPGGDLRPAARIELGHDVVQVCLGRLLGYAERAADLPVGAPGRDEGGHLLLAAREHDRGCPRGSSISW